MSARYSRVVVTRASPGPRDQIDRQSTARRSTKLTISQEEALVNDIFDLDKRGYPLHISDVETMASFKRHLAYLDESKDIPKKGWEVGIKWAEDFVARTPELEACLKRNKAYHDDTKFESLELASRWFKLIQETKAQYEISDNNIFTLAEVRFLINPLSIAIATTPAQHQQRTRTRGHEQHRWATVLQAIGAAGQVIPPTVIFKDDHYLRSWYTDDTPRGWLINNSTDGCNTFKILGDWKNVFNFHTKEREPGTWRLLIQNSPKAGLAADWDMYCKSSQIIPICIPPGLSSLLQPLELGCIKSLNTAYQAYIKTLRRHRTTSMTDNEFLVGLEESLALSLTAENITAGFQTSGIVPFNPRAVLPQGVTLEEVKSWEAPQVPSPPLYTHEMMVLCGSEFREAKVQIISDKGRKRKRTN